MNNTKELTQEEISEGYFVDPVLGRCNIKKAFKERNEAVRKEYEAFNIIHSNDGIVNKSKRSGKL